MIGASLTTLVPARRTAPCDDEPIELSSKAKLLALVDALADLDQSAHTVLWECDHPGALEVVLYWAEARGVMAELYVRGEAASVTLRRANHTEIVVVRLDNAHDHQGTS